MNTTITTMKQQEHHPIALALIMLVFNLLLFTPAKADSWTNTDALSNSRKGHIATLLPNGKVLVAGGEDLSSAEIYDPATARHHISLGSCAFTAMPRNLAPRFRMV